MPDCKVVEVLQDFLSEYVDKKFTRDYNVILYLSIFNSFLVIRCLSQFISPKISMFTTFLFPLGTPLWQSRKTLHEWKDNSVLAKPSQHVLIHLQQFPSYSNRKCKKSPFSRTAAHIFVSPGDAPAIITQYVAWMKRQFNACQTPHNMYLSIFTLNVVWMEREFDAYKLPRCMCPSNYNRFWDRARYWSKIVIFHTPLAFDAPIRGVPVWISPPRLVRKISQVWNVGWSSSKSQNFRIFGIHLPQRGISP